MAKGSLNLRQARQAKRDEFFTKYEDIESECNKYKEYFSNKIIYLNCDDTTSEFFNFFKNNFQNFNLKKVIATHYDKEKVPLGYTIERGGFINTFYLYENGDFRSEECIEIMKQSDIVITNPPFSLFREFVDQLIRYDKHFLIIGNENAVTYKNILFYIMDNKIREGYNSPRPKEFFVPEDYENKNTFIDESTGRKIAKFGNILWFTNLPVKTRDKDLELTASYYDEQNKREDYFTYDNYDAINVNRVKNIPKDYFGIMGVPITFLSYHNPNQFIILGDSRYHDDNETANDINFINGKIIYRRLLIQRKV